MINSLFGGLVQRTLVEYDLDESRRVPGKTFRRVIELTLPLFLTTELWERHDYSISDIRTTLEYFSAIHLWQCALLHGISASNSAIKLAFSTPESMIYGSKAIVIRKIEKLVSKQFSENSPSVLDTLTLDHIPPIPVHSITHNQWVELSNILPKKPVNLLDTLHYTGSFKWKNIILVPMWLEKNSIYSIRIIPLSIFNASGRIKKPSLSNKPLSIIVNGELFAGLEEACFFNKK
jgi:hypothetical protein